jgi:hypothetical protein
MWNFGSLISALSTEILSLSDGAGAFCSGTLNISRICLMFVKKKCHYYSYMIKHLWPRHCSGY